VYILNGYLPKRSWYTQQEAQLLVTLQQREAAVAAVRAANEDKQRAVASAEAMFARVRQATGVNTLEEMVAKFSNQVTDMFNNLKLTYHILCQACVERNPKIVRANTEL
jgi:predicted HAD superfamily Cof-like phosphohydrolase